MGPNKMFSVLDTTKLTSLCVERMDGEKQIILNGVWWTVVYDAHKQLFRNKNSLISEYKISLK